ncbi:MAG: hypothetical protein GY913_08950 [Proteobacteria bacterium]|nr:hypothetical protein [Pseudomonadota bacterium]MCP4917038.1 hypothetical protein [Pseudomonadota bacterium]
MIVVTGFGPFLDVSENPSGALARAVDGARVRGHTVRGVELPVSYERAPRQVIELVRSFAPVLVLGLGVATRRSGAQVERQARNRGSQEHADMDGQRRTRLGRGPEVVRCPIADPLAAALEIGTSNDAGDYVCNAWLYGVSRGLAGTDVAFVHISTAMEPAWLLRGLGRWLEDR